MGTNGWFRRTASIGAEFGTTKNSFAAMLNKKPSR